MSLNLNVSLINPDLNEFEKMYSIEMLILYGITISGLIVNIFIMIYLLIIAAYRMKSSCFLFHHCLICLTLSILCFPYSLSFLNYPIRCNYLANIQVTCVTAQLLNMAAMVASEAYRFEDLIHQDILEEEKTSSNHQQQQHQHQHYQYQIKQTNQSTISCGCLSFGILIIWFSSIILHLGITMIGSESKSYYENDNQSCSFLIRDIRGYVLTLMWVIIIIFSLMITLRYIHKILSEVSLNRQHNQPLLSLAILGQFHGQSIASKDILIQQIEQRIKLNILLIILFILFWFPLFISILIDMKFKIHKQILRYFLLFAWSNSSISPLTYLLLLSKCSDFCRLCFQKDRSSTYDSLTSYYNRIGDRFHDIGKWDEINQLNLNEQNKNKSTKDNSFQLKDFSSDLSDQSSHHHHHHTKVNSLLVKEIPSHLNHLTTTTTTKKTHHLSNGLIVTSKKKDHLEKN